MSRLSIPKELLKAGLLKANLNGVAEVLRRELGLKHLRYSLDDKIKSAQANDNDITYPYAWIVPTDGRMVKDQISNRAVQRYGLRTGNAGATRNTTQIGFVFPVQLGMELHFVDSDASRLMHMMEVFLILSGINRLTFDVRFRSDLILNTRIEIPDSVSIPIADTGDTTKPGGGELTLSLIIHTYAGFLRDVSSVYAQPTIGINIEGTDQMEEYECAIPQEFVTNEPPTP